MAQTIERVASTKSQPQADAFREIAALHHAEAEKE
jgi:hypothetical protein